MRENLLLCGLAAAEYELSENCKKLQIAFKPNYTLKTKISN